MAGLSTFQSGPKGSEMVNLDVSDNLGLIWAHEDTYNPFRTKIILSPNRGAFCTSIIHTQISPQICLWTHLDHFGTLTSLPCLAIFVFLDTLYLLCSMYYIQCTMDVCMVPKMLALLSSQFHIHREQKQQS